MADDVNYPYGKLNNVKTKKFTPIVEVNSNDTLSQLKKVLEDRYTDKLDDTGEFVGIVLRRETSPDDGFFSGIYSSATSWFSSGDEDNIEFVAFRVRVPEVDSLIPEPTDYENDLFSIGLHKIFRAPRDQFSDIDSLAPGSLVVVSYKDGQGRDRPTLLRKWTKTAPVDDRKTDPKGAFAQGASGNVSVGSNYAPIPPPERLGREISTVKDHTGKTIITLNECTFRENRVSVNEAITELPVNSPVLVEVPSPRGKQQKLHTLVAKRFNLLREAAKNEIGADILVKSGHRKMAWKSREEYLKFLEKSYVYNPDSTFFYQKLMTPGVSKEKAINLSFKKSEGYKAFISPHMTGMVVDFYIEPVKTGDVLISPSSLSNNYVISTKDGDIKIEDASTYGGVSLRYQAGSSAYLWLVENARRFGFTPFYKEPWHWECLLTINAWKTGEEFTTDYAVSVTEKSIANGTVTRSKEFRYE